MSGLTVTQAQAKLDRHRGKMSGIISCDADVDETAFIEI
jgi:hypothetical protein